MKWFLVSICCITLAAQQGLAETLASELRVAAVYISTVTLTQDTRAQAQMEDPQHQQSESIISINAQLLGEPDKVKTHIQAAAAALM